MAGVLKFPKLGSEKTLSLIEEPTRDEEETAEEFQARLEQFNLFRDVEITIKLVDRETSRAWAMRWEAIAVRDKKRIAEAEKKGDAATTITGEGVQELIRLQRDILKSALIKLVGIQYGDTLSDTVTDPGGMIEIADGCGILSACAIAASRGQAPTPTQGEV